MVDFVDSPQPREKGPVGPESRARLRKDILVPGYRLPGTSVCLCVCLYVYLCALCGARVYGIWYQDTGYPVHRCVCVSISPPHPTHPHPTPPQVVWWCYVSMCDLWWYGGEVAQTKKEILVPGYRLPGTSVCLYGGTFAPW